MMTDDELIRPLFTEGDRLTREKADAVVARGEAIVPRLAAIVEDAAAWKAEGDAAWAPVHATYLLGAIGGAEALAALVRGLRRAGEADTGEWVMDEFPAIFAALGPPAVAPLREVAFDSGAARYSRHVACEALSAVAAGAPDLQERVADIFRDLAVLPDAPLDIRGCAGMVLLDFARPEDRPLLEQLVREQERDMRPPTLFGAESIETAYREGRQLDPVAADWIDFYDADEIEARQRRWAEEGQEEAYEAEEGIAHEDEHAYAYGEGDPPPRPFVHTEAAPGRNDPCPCGSGKKHKKCCGLK